MGFTNSWHSVQRFGEPGWVEILPRVIVVTGADSKYFPLLCDCIQSLRAFPELAEIEIGVIDLGLDAAHHEWLKGQSVSVVPLGWDVDLSNYPGVPTYFKAMTARPHLPRHFPNHDIIMWLDADIWVQDRAFVKIYLDAAGADGFAVTPEIDRAYSILYGGQNTLRLFHHNVYAQCFGRLVADRLIDFPILNSGAFAIHRSHPIWEEWRKALLRTINTVVLLHSEQAALNYAAYLSPGLPRPHMLPATANWVCAQALPKWDPQRKKLVEPNFPHASLGLIHLTGIKSEQRIPMIGGGEVLTALTRTAMQNLANNGRVS